MQTVPVTAVDGHQFELRHFAVADAINVIVIFPAMGVPAKFYNRMARNLNTQGIAVVVSELRGVGSSSLRAARDTDFGYRELLTQDFPLAEQYAREQYPQAERSFLGHSLGGQLGCAYLSLHPEAASRLFLIASCNTGARGFGNGVLGVFPRVGMRSLGRFMRTYSIVRGYFPGQRFGFAGRESRGVVQDWAYTVRTCNYRMRGPIHDFEPEFARFKGQVIACPVEGDSYAPRSAVELLTAKMTGAQVRWHPVTAAEFGPGLDHFNWAKRETLGAYIGAILRGRS